MPDSDSPPDANDPKAELLRLEVRVLEAERRFVPAVLHFIDARNKYPLDDARRRAARSALLWCFFPFNNAASTAGFIGLILTLATVYLAFQANTMLRQDLAEVRAQNDLIRQQFEFARQQFDTQRRAEAHRRRSELLATLHARQNCPDGRLRHCPFVADQQARMLALSELSDLQDVFDSTGNRTKLTGIEFRNEIFPSGTRLAGLSFDDIDLSHAEFPSVYMDAVVITRGSNTGPTRSRMRSTQFRDGNLTAVIFNRADLRGAIFNGATLRNVQMGLARLEGARFEDATLDRVDFLSSNLQGVDFSRARLTNCTFERARLDGAVFPELNDGLAAALGAAATCPDGQSAEGSCVGKMSPVVWTTEELTRLRRYFDRVEADLMLIYKGVDSTDSSALLEITPPTGVEPLDVEEIQSTIDPAHLVKVREALLRHAGMLELTSAGVFDERVRIEFQKALVTVTSGHTE